MTDHVISIDGGSQQYWTDLRRAYALIRELERCSDICRRAPLYRGHYISEDGDMEIYENIEPFDDLDDALKAVQANPKAMRILNAQGRDPRQI